MSKTVIIGRGRHAKRSAYHTDVCFQVWELDTKAYTTKEKAEARGMSHCQYCSGEFSTKGSDDSKLSYKLEKADPAEVFGDD